MWEFYNRNLTKSHLCWSSFIVDSVCHWKHSCTCCYSMCIFLLYTVHLGALLFPSHITSSKGMKRRIWTWEWVIQFLHLPHLLFAQYQGRRHNHYPCNINRWQKQLNVMRECKNRTRAKSQSKIWSFHPWCLLILNLFRTCLCSCFLSNQ